MIRGIEFELRQENTNDILKKIVETVGLEIQYWFIPKAQCEVWSSDFNDTFLTHELYYRTDFVQKCSLPFNVIFLKVQAYLHPKSFENITTYSEYIQSNCQLIILISDCKYVEIYCKEIDVLQKFFACFRDQAENLIRWITDNNDSRTSMDIL